MTTETKKILLPLLPHLREFAETRALRVASPGGLAIASVLSECIDRYAALIAAGNAELTGNLTTDELDTALRGMGSVAFTGDPTSFLHAALDVAEQADDEDLPELAAKLRALSLPARAALADRCEIRRADREKARVTSGVLPSGRRNWRKKI